MKTSGLRTRWGALVGLLVPLTAGAIPVGPAARAAETALRMAVASPDGIEAPGAPEVLVPVGQGGADVVLDVVLDTALEPCFSDPAACAGEENFRERDPVTSEDIFGCADGTDNDGDGLLDLDDADCRGVSGWSFSVITAPCFNVAAVTISGTAADLESAPPGRRDPEGSFEKTAIVDPDLNDGKQGAVTAVVLSLQRPLLVPPVGEWVVLKLSGVLEASGAGPGEVGPPCEISIPEQDEPGLIGVLEPVRTVVTVRGRSLAPETRDMVLRASSGMNASGTFRRGDCNADGELNLTDGVSLLNYLFLQGPRPPCAAACDANADGELNITAAVFLLNYLFLEGPSPPPPFPDCGSAAGEALSCETSAGCA